MFTVLLYESSASLKCSKLEGALTGCSLSPHFMVSSEERLWACAWGYSPAHTWNLGQSWLPAAQYWSKPGQQRSSSERRPQREAPSHWRWAALQKRRKNIQKQNEHLQHLWHNIRATLMRRLGVYISFGDFCFLHCLSTGHAKLLLPS